MDALIREWCCSTPIMSPHMPGCAFEPRPDEPVDYSGPFEIRPPGNPTAAV